MVWFYMGYKTVRIKNEDVYSGNFEKLIPYCLFDK